MTERKDQPIPLTERLLPGSTYLYDQTTIDALREAIGDRPVVIFNGLNTLYAEEPDPDKPDRRKPFYNVQATIDAIREQVPDVFIIGWTGKGPRENVANAIGNTVDLMIGEKNATLQIPDGTPEEERLLLQEKATRDYHKIVAETPWLEDYEKDDLKRYRSSTSMKVKNPQIFTRGRIVIIDRNSNIPDINNNPSVTFINSDGVNGWAQSKIMPFRELPNRIVEALRPPLQRR